VKTEEERERSERKYAAELRVKRLQGGHDIAADFLIGTVFNQYFSA